MGNSVVTINDRRDVIKNIGTDFGLGNPATVGHQAQLCRAIVTWIERTYHGQRRRRALGKLTPIKSELLPSPVANAAGNSQPKVIGSTTRNPGFARSVTHVVHNQLPAPDNLPRLPRQCRRLEIVLAAADLVAWAQLIGFTDTPSWPPARSPPSATGSCTSQPASPAEPANYSCASTPPGAGPASSRPPGNASAPPSPEPAATPCPDDPKTHRPWESPPTPATRDSQRHPKPKTAIAQQFSCLSAPETHQHENLRPFASPPRANRT